MTDNVTLVTLQKGKAHLRVVTDVEDEDITSKIEMASAIVLDYLKLSAPPASWDTDSGESPGDGVPMVVQSAVLLVLGELYKNREASVADLLPPAMVSLLMRLRDPTLA